MRKKLRRAALVVAGLALLIWLVRGANTGWTKNTVPRVVKDPVTELEGRVYEPRWVPGVDFLAAALVVAGAAAGCSFLFKRRG